ncbi:hypothetical protein LJC69_05395 [Bacteroidales bacterium OttesenSCG-928-K22]|nr:hypothetical protein [Bacteroidales bacterium OttesenSCG-928-L14]MDL2241041.1 hypothetical protein [Bacteroidales bacterium OttesenSCG-928-K22]
MIIVAFAENNHYFIGEKQSLLQTSEPKPYGVGLECIGASRLKWHC